MESSSLFDTIILGVIQGLTEFLPVSSSAHLIFVSQLQDGKVLPLSLNIAFHIGTLLAVLGYFWRDWFALSYSVANLVFKRQKSALSTRIFPALLVGSIPAGVIGILFKDSIEATFHHPMMTVVPLVVMGIALWLVDKYSKSYRKIDSISLLDALIIGITQALALIPGSSRSGSTILGARLLGFSKIESARFSFLLGTPAMLGAAILDSKGLLEAAQAPHFLTGVIVAAVVGCLAIKMLLSFVSKFGFLAFAIYRIALAVLIVAVAKG
jgi:undecaprenyl-diphosphatase